GARLDAAAAYPRARAAPSARWLGEPACERGTTGRFSRRRTVLRGVLPDAGRESPGPRPGAAIPRGGPSPRRSHSGHVWRVLLPEREPEDTGDLEHVHA